MSVISPRNLTVVRGEQEQNAFTMIQKWVREQGVVEDPRDINGESTRLFGLWRAIPRGGQQVVFTRIGLGIPAGHHYE